MRQLLNFPKFIICTIAEKLYLCAMGKSEFSFIGDIARLFGELPHNGFEPIGDDCTAVDIGGDEVMVFTTDMLIEDVHFLRGASSAEEVGEKSLMVNLSDVASMGVRPVATLLSIALPESAQGEWADGFMRGYYEASKRCGVALVGGDTTAAKEKIAINVVAIGRGNKSCIKRRSSANVGDVIAVTGSLGASSKGLVDIMFGDLNTSEAKIHRRAQARITEGEWLGRCDDVHAMMDISDGIASDIRHIMELSQVGAHIDINTLPTQYDYRYAVSGGEDYELLLTIAADRFEDVAKRFTADTGCELTKIGEIVDGDSLTWLERGEPTELNLQGFTHF